MDHGFCCVLASLSIGIHTIDLTVGAHVLAVQADEQAGLSHLAHILSHTVTLTCSQHGHSTCWAVGHTVSFQVQLGGEVLAPSLIHVQACTIQHHVHELVAHAVSHHRAVVIACCGGSLECLNQGGTVHVLVREHIHQHVTQRNHIRVAEDFSGPVGDLCIGHGIGALTDHLNGGVVPDQALIRLGQVQAGFLRHDQVTHRLVRLWVVLALHHGAAGRSSLVLVVDTQIQRVSTTDRSFRLNASHGSHSLIETTQHGHILAVSRLTCLDVHALEGLLAQHGHHVLCLEFAQQFQEGSIDAVRHFLLCFLCSLFFLGQTHVGAQLCLADIQISWVEVGHIFHSHISQAGQHRRDALQFGGQCHRQVAANLLDAAFREGWDLLRSVWPIEVIGCQHDAGVGVHHNLFDREELVSEFLSCRVCAMHHGVEEVGGQTQGNGLCPCQWCIVSDRGAPVGLDLVTHATDGVQIAQAHRHQSLQLRSHQIGGDTHVAGHLGLGHLVCTSATRSQEPLACCHTGSLQQMRLYGQRAILGLVQQCGE